MYSDVGKCIAKYDPGPKFCFSVDELFWSILCCVTVMIVIQYYVISLQGPPHDALVPMPPSQSSGIISFNTPII